MTMFNSGDSGGRQAWSGNASAGTGNSCSPERCSTARQYGGRYVARGRQVETLEGIWSPKRLVILEFLSVEQAKAWWISAEYAEAKALRQAVAHTQMIVVAGR
jgi:uncharacterized protein (DUF1330 family)